ncbi:NUDIX domain-containing protein [Rhodopila sp.]|uniref:NUDIX domain-containing protein n=1 Tax=Rhodopila sp. TaxID=2480087 RepID=UPI003D1204C7
MRNRTTAPIPHHADVVIDATDRVWPGLFPLDVVKFRQRRFDGAMSDTHTWELLRRGRASALVPYDPWTDSVVMIEQFRLAALAAGVQTVLVELPAGLCEDNEAPEATIQREIQEETRLRTDRLERIGSFLLSPGATDEICELYAGRVQAPAAGEDGIVGYAGEAAENEDIRVRVWHADAAIEAALAGRFTNVITALGLFWLAAKRDWLRQIWMDP